MIIAKIQKNLQVMRWIKMTQISVRWFCNFAEFLWKIPNWFFFISSNKIMYILKIKVICYKWMETQMSIFSSILKFVTSIKADFSCLPKNLGAYFHHNSKFEIFIWLFFNIQGMKLLHSIYLFLVLLSRNFLCIKLLAAH